jgi:hypothetical protein
MTQVDGLLTVDEDGRNELKERPVALSSKFELR